MGSLQKIRKTSVRLKVLLMGFEVRIIPDSCSCRTLILTFGYQFRQGLK